MTTDANDPRIAKLPGWAQTLIGDLGRTIDRQEEQINELTKGPEESNTIVNPDAEIFHKGAKPMRLKSGTEIEFQLGDGFGQHLKVMVIDRGDGNVVELRGERNLVVKPTASNCLHIFAVSVIRG